MPFSVDASVVVQDGVERFLARDYLRAISAFQAALVRDPVNVRARLMSGLAKACLGRRASARADLSRVLREAPRSPAGLLLRGLALRGLDQAEAARESVGRILRLPVPDLETLMQAATFFYEEGHCKSALECLASYLRSGGDRLTALRLQARLYDRAGLLRRSRGALKEAISLDPRSAELRTLAAEAALKGRDYESAQAHVDAALVLQPREPRALRLSAELRLWRGEYAAAFARSQAVLAMNPADPAALCARGAARLLRGRSTQARADLLRALALAPDFSLARVWLAEAELRGGRPAAALELVDTAIRRSSDILSARIVRALCLIELASPGWRGDWRRIVSELGPLAEAGADAWTDSRVVRRFLWRVLRLMRGNRTAPPTVVRVERGRRLLCSAHHPAARYRDETRQAAMAAQLALRRGGLSCALETFDLLMDKRLDPLSRALAHCYRGEVYLWYGRAGPAAADFRRAIALDRRTKWAYVGLCGARTLQARFGSALAHADAALKLGARSVYVWQGEALRKAGSLPQAIAALEKSLEQHPQRLGALLNLGLAYLEAGRPGQARRLLARCRALAPELLRDAGAALGRRRGVRAVIEAALTLSRGNRSSWMNLYFDAQGRVKLWGEEGGSVCARASGAA